jgi:hypothetical protein
MSGSRPHSTPARVRNRRTEGRGAGSSWPTWLACAGLLLGAHGSAARRDPPWAPSSGGAAPPSVGESAPASEAARKPRLAPDYVEVVIPPNLAPLNLAVQEPGVEYQLRVSGSRGQPLELRQSQPRLCFPLREWKALLETNRGGTLRWNISVRNPAGQWMSYAPFENRVAEEEIDPYLVYRRLRPLYTSYRYMGIYQRHLETFDEQPLVRSITFGHGCVNCHTPLQGAPDRFAISFRARTGTPTLLVQSNRISRIETKMGYLSWHPSGKLLAFADNTITQIFHVAGPVNRDVYEPHAHLRIFHVDTQTIEKPAALTAPNRTENWPSWAPDGRHLYYCSAPTVAFRDWATFRYDLVRIPYDPDHDQWGKPETLFSAAEHHQSAHQPRVSPDGRHLVFTVSDSGSFPAFRPDSDLFLLRLDSRKLEPLPINSDQVETWHSWSSNSRWLVFGSRRLDGVFARLWITHVDSDGHFSKPLLLPQEDPAYYDTCLDNFNAPELARAPVQISEAEFARVINTPANKTAPPNHDGSPPDPAPDESANPNQPYP